MSQQIVAWSIAAAVVVAVAAGEPWPRRQVSADDSNIGSVNVTVHVDGSTSTGSPSAPTDQTDDVSVERTFPVADLIAGPPDGGPAFKDASELMRLLRRMTGPRHWREARQMQWLERRQLLRVHNTSALVEQVEQLLTTLRNPGPSHVGVTVRLLVLPHDCVETPSFGAAQVVSSAKARRLWKTWHSDRSDRDHEAEYSLADRDIVYTWTIHRDGHEMAARGLNAVVQPADDGSRVRITAYPFPGDERKVDWPELAVGVGQSAVYDLPVSDAAPEDVARVLAMLTVTSVTPSGGQSGR